MTLKDVLDGSRGKWADGGDLFGEVEAWAYGTERECPDCRGLRRLNVAYCPTCHGTGKVREAGLVSQWSDYAALVGLDETDFVMVANFLRAELGVPMTDDDDLTEFIRDMASPSDGPDLTDEELGEVLAGMATPTPERSEPDEDRMEELREELARDIGMTVAVRSAAKYMARLEAQVATLTAERDALQVRVGAAQVVAEQAIAERNRLAEALRVHYEAMYHNGSVSPLQRDEARHLIATEPTEDPDDEG